jgi:hypothetical protein
MTVLIKSVDLSPCISHEKKLSKIGHLVMFLCFLNRKTHCVFRSKANRRTPLKESNAKHVKTLYGGGRWGCDFGTFQEVNRRVMVRSQCFCCTCRLDEVKLHWSSYFKFLYKSFTENYERKQRNVSVKLDHHACIRNGDFGVSRRRCSL